ncbi:MAG TPA: glycosyltransferase [Gammaproteobacteria bacterium]|nr:glycosyltransferase [Gammaproteobacteria bacterium]
MAVVLTSYYRPRPGGCCKRYFRAIRALLEQGHTVHYLAVCPFPVNHPDCHFHRFPWPQNKTENLLFWGMFFLFAPVQLLFLGLRQRVTHLFAFDSLYVFLLQPLRILKRIPLSFFVRGDAVEQHRLKDHGKFIILAETVTEALAIAHVRMYSVAETLQKNILCRHRFFRPEHVQVFPNEIPQLKLISHKLSSPMHMACVGILEKRKNQSLIIDCMAHIDAASAKLYLYGTGPAEAEFKEQADNLQLQNQIVFAGWVDADLFWPQVDLLLFPSLLEGAPNAMLEAIACGVAVLASDIPEHREILPHASLLDPSDSQAWTKRIQSIIQKKETILFPLRQEQADYTRRLRFDWDAEVVKKILDS